MHEAHNIVFTRRNRSCEKKNIKKQEKSSSPSSCVFHSEKSIKRIIFVWIYESLKRFFFVTPTKIECNFGAKPEIDSIVNQMRIVGNCAIFYDFLHSRWS